MLVMMIHDDGNDVGGNNDATDGGDVNNANQ